MPNTGCMTKKYFVKLCDHCDLKDPLYLITREVTRKEYIMLGHSECRAIDDPTLDGMLEMATKHAGVCGTKHLFWAEDYKFPEYLIISHDAETALEIRLLADTLDEAEKVARKLKILSRENGMKGWSTVPGFEVAVYRRCNEVL